ncbi:hypothetical protein [Pseudomonas asiatica]|uniref:hypothetical protein n=1 Tax=Pseudomonas asiatica TaxID=2219225 RepID=UPI002015FDA8|nr:hypothetical protein [Pseudomonas asiatica]
MITTPNDFIAISGASLKGKVVVTGTFQPSAERLPKLWSKEPGKVSSKVSSKTSFVVAGESAGSKLEAAKDLDIDVWMKPGYWPPPRAEYITGRREASQSIKISSGEPENVSN